MTNRNLEKTRKQKFHRVLSLVKIILVLSILFPIPMQASAGICEDDRYAECRGQRDINYLVKDVDDFERPYSYIIGKTKFWYIEIAGVLAILGAIGFGVFHGFGRYIAAKRFPVKLEKEKSVFIYKFVIRVGHWINAFSVIALIVSGFVMHFVGPTHFWGQMHNGAGIVFVICWILFFGYEVASFDYKQFLIDDWELREGIFKQVLFYAIGIFKQEEHPYHMEVTARLNPLQKLAYFGVMFFLVPLVGFTGMMLISPDLMSPIVNFIGLENMKYVFIFHLCGAFGMVAYLFGHIYLGTTGDKVLQHYKVIFTGYHDVYKHETKKVEG
jgi:thiosulfate reductase cytochrome b subunit